MDRLSDAAIEIINTLHRERIDYNSEYLPLIDALNRLSAYEDTGLEPGDILSSVELAKVACALHELNAYKNLGSADHFRELLEAEQNKSSETNADRIRGMSDEELAKFLSSIAYGRETPWSLPFEEKFCKSCPTVHCTYESGAEDDFRECDFVDGKCQHGSDMVWWLQQPAEEV